MVLRTSIRFAYLKDIFQDSPRRTSVFNANIGRLIVLYEDLRIEIASFQATSIKDADCINEGSYRKRYFLRRSIATLIEFSDAFSQLSHDEHIDSVTVAFDKKGKYLWSDTVALFKKHSQLLKNVRNDLGGHFGTKAAIYAIESLTPKITGQLATVRDYSREGILYLPLFVGEITARSFLRHLEGDSIDERYRKLLKIVQELQLGAIQSVQNLLQYYLWPKFNGP